VNRLLGRGKSPGPSKNWVLSTLIALVLAFVAWIGIFTYQSVEVWTPLQQWYWVQYSISKDFPNPIAQIYPKAPKDLFYLSEKFIGRLIGWFDDQLFAINIQFIPEDE
jgi:hypothetical protein